MFNWLCHLTMIINDNKTKLPIYAEIDCGIVHQCQENTQIFSHEIFMCKTTPGLSRHPGSLMKKMRGLFCKTESKRIICLFNDFELIEPNISHLKIS